jgi:hypothetical protein
MDIYDNKTVKQTCIAKRMRELCWGLGPDGGHDDGGLTYIILKRARLSDG